MYTESTPAIADTRRPHAGKLSPASLLHQSDERLVALARSGSERAWGEITRRYGRQLRAYCTRFVGPSRAEDAVQQTFLQAFLALRDGRQREIALRAWLYRIAHNCSIDLLRKGCPDYEQLDLEYDGVAQPPTLFEQREEVRRLVARMRDLPDAQRQALALRELEGRSYEEISAQLGHSGSGVRQLIFRARTALRNSAPSILPLGFLKGRLTQPVPLECHHVANAVAVPASSGNGVDAVGAATLAVVAVLGGGFAAADGGSRRARPPHDVPAGAVPSPVASAGSISAAAATPPAPQARTGSGFSVRLPGRRAAGEDTTLTAAAPLVAGPVAGVPPAAPAPVAQDIAPAVTPAPAIPEPAGQDMRQQSDASAGASGGPAAPSTGAPAGSPGGSAAPGTPSGSTTSAPGPGMPAGVAPGGPAGTGTTKGRTPVPPKASPPPTSKPVKAQPPKVPPKSEPKAPPKALAPKAQPPKVAPKAAAPRVQAPARKSERG